MLLFQQHILLEYDLMSSSFWRCCGRHRHLAGRVWVGWRSKSRSRGLQDSSLSSSKFQWQYHYSCRKVPTERCVIVQFHVFLFVYPYSSQAVCYISSGPRINNPSILRQELFVMTLALSWRSGERGSARILGTAWWLLKVWMRTQKFVACLPLVSLQTQVRLSKCPIVMTYLS